MFNLTIPRPEYELFDRKSDPEETINVSSKPRYARALARLSAQLTAWQNVTADPWMCGAHAVLEDGECMPLYN